MEIQKDCISGLCFISEVIQERELNIIINSGLIKKFFTLDYTYVTNYRLLHDISKLIGNLLTFDVLTEEFVNMGCLEFVKTNCTSLSPDIRLAAVWILCNIMSTNDNQILYVVIKSGVLGNALALIYDTNYKIVKETTWLIGLIIQQADYETISFLLGAGMWDNIFHILVNFSEVELLKVMLEALTILLEKGKGKFPNVFLEDFTIKGGLDLLVSKNHKNEIVKLLIDNLLELYSMNKN
jgi:hypothetical protein